MKMSSPPPVLPTIIGPDKVALPSHSFGHAIWDLIMAYSSVVGEDEMRQELEDALSMYYDICGDGTAGSA